MIPCLNKDCTNKTNKRLDRGQRQTRFQRFLVGPARASARWDNFAAKVVIPAERRENFRMSGVSFKAVNVFKSCLCVRVDSRKR